MQYPLRYLTSDCDEETLLSCLWLYSGPFQNWIRTADSDSLDRGGTDEAEDILLAVLLARGLEGISNGKEDCRSKEKGRLADATRTLDGT